MGPDSFGELMVFVNSDPHYLILGETTYLLLEATSCPEKFTACSYIICHCRPSPLHQFVYLYNGDIGVTV